MSDKINFVDLSFGDKLKNIFTFDVIRIQKLLEISQHMIIGLFVGFYLGYLIDQIFQDIIQMIINH